MQRKSLEIVRAKSNLGVRGGSGEAAENVLQNGAEKASYGGSMLPIQIKSGVLSRPDLLPCISLYIQ